MRRSSYNCAECVCVFVRKRWMMLKHTRRLTFIFHTISHIYILGSQWWHRKHMFCVATRDQCFIYEYVQYCMWSWFKKLQKSSSFILKTIEKSTISFTGKVVLTTGASSAAAIHLRFCHCYKIEWRCNNKSQSMDRRFSRSSSMWQQMLSALSHLSGFGG